MSNTAQGVRREVRGGRTRWVIDFSYLNREGRKARYRRDARIHTASGARAEARRLMELAVRGELDRADDDEPVTFRAFVVDVFEPTYLPTYRPETRNRYRALLHRQGVLERFGKMRLSEISTLDIRSYATSLVNRGVNTKGPTNFVRTVLRAAVESKTLARMPDWPKGIIRVSRKIPEAPSEDEVRTMRATFSGWIRTASALAALAGLRMGEVVALEVRDVDLVKRELHIRHALSGGERVTPKSGHERSVPMVPALVAVMTDAIKGKFPKSRIVVTSTGATPPRQEVLRVFKLNLKRANLPERTFHQLRHFFCSTLVKRGASIEAVRVLAGHSSLAITERYIHANDADKRDAVMKLITI